MKQYLEALNQIRTSGVDRQGRNGMTRALFAYQCRWNLQEGFPLVTTKQVSFHLIKSELLWFLSGSTDENDLKALVGKEKTIWSADAEKPSWKPKARFLGDLGRIYGAQWRNWPGTIPACRIDQIQTLINLLRHDHYSRYGVVTAWNPTDVDCQALGACHMIFQVFAFEGKLSLHMVQRSCDMFLGVPFNIASYALLLSMLAQVTDHDPHELVITFNDAHIYHEHFAAVDQQLGREPFPLPKLLLNLDIKEIDDFGMDDIKLANYQHHEAIKAPMIVAG